MKERNIQKLNRAVIDWWISKTPFSREQIEEDIAKGYQLGFGYKGKRYISHNKGKI
tara:strand:- start:2678 stop:2845 length:168 start_codon:yes stop_codon:yes gene_type:complete